MRPRYSKSLLTAEDASGRSDLIMQSRDVIYGIRVYTRIYVYAYTYTRIYGKIQPYRIVYGSYRTVT